MFHPLKLAHVYTRDKRRCECVLNLNVNMHFFYETWTLLPMWPRTFVYVNQIRLFWDVWWYWLRQNRYFLKPYTQVFPLNVMCLTSYTLLFIRWVLILTPFILFYVRQPQTGRYRLWTSIPSLEQNETQNEIKWLFWLLLWDFQILLGDVV